MKNTFKILLSMLLLLGFNSVSATQAPWDLQAVMVSDTSISIDWQDVTDVLGYYIYYGESTGSWSDYDIEWVDLIEDSEYVLTDLNPETRYYIAMTAVDDTWSESEKSPELEATTLLEWEEAQAVNLRISEAKVIDDTSIEMVFSLDMETWSSAQRDFIIENVDTWMEIWVDISDVVPGKPQNILAILDTPLTPGSQYKITVLAIKDKDGNTIESWIDAFVNFTTPSVFVDNLEAAGTETPDAWQEENSEIIESESELDEMDNIESELDQQEDVVQVTDNTIDNNQIASVWNNAGTNISNDDLSENTLNAAAENDKLPQTGPEHWILWLIAIMFSTGIFYRLKK